MEENSKKWVEVTDVEERYKLQISIRMAAGYLHMLSANLADEKISIKETEKSAIDVVSKLINRINHEKK